MKIALLGASGRIGQRISLVVNSLKGGPILH